MIWKLFVISTAIIAMYMAIMDNKAPETTIAWLLIFVIYPPVGVILYLFLGINWKRKTLNSGNTKEIKELINSYIAASENKEYKNLVELLAANSDSPIFVNNEVEIFGNGETVRQRRSGSVRRSDRRDQRDPLRRDPRGACRH